MTDKVLEQLSAGVDDELDGAEWPMLERRVAGDPELRGRWARYHLIGDTLRGRHGGPRAEAGFARRVAAAVAAEGIQAPAASTGGRWLRSAAGMAIAASVAAVALLTLRVDGPDVQTEPGVVVPVTANPKVPAGVRYAAGPAVQWDRARPEVQAQLNSLLLDHTDGIAPDEAAQLAEEEPGR